MNTLGFIGLGNMGLALLKGVSSSSVLIFGYDVSPEKQNAVENCGGTCLNSEAEIAQKCKYILLGVKPQSAGEVLEKIKPELTHDSVIISICAGISAKFIRERTSPNQKVICVMPNTPMMLGEGASALSSDSLTAPEETEFARTLIGSCSPVVETISPDKMNEVIAINGSSPAFIYLFAKCVTDYAAQHKVEAESALRLFAQTLVGAGKMLLESGASVDELISQVSSPGGTTVAGLQQLRESGFQEAVKSACEACTKRAYELGK